MSARTFAITGLSGEVIHTNPDTGLPWTEIEARDAVREAALFHDVELRVVIEHGPNPPREETDHGSTDNDI